MNSIQTLYKLMEVSSRDLEIPDAYQRKLNTERVAKIVAGFNERIANEPKVSFRDGHYYVFDGQHTIVARKHMNGNNDLPILCKVYYGMTEADEALLFAMQTGYSAALTPSARLRANLRGEDKASGEFYAATEEAGLHVGFERGGGTGRILCINTAFAEFRRAGAELYKEALTILLEAWGGDPDSLRAEVIQGIVHFVELYHGEYDRERLIYSLRAYEPKFIYAAGKAEKELRGVKRYVNIFYRIYTNTFILFVCQRKKLYFFLISAILRTRIMYILFCYCSLPEPCCSRCLAIGIIILWSSAIPCKGIIGRSQTECKSQTRQFRKYSLW